MLHDPSHYTPIPAFQETTVSSYDRDILRGLAEKKVAIGSLPVQKEKADLWRKLNDLKPVRPMVWINEICWNEMDFDDELKLCCEGEWAREQEILLRRELYQWNHLPADMVINPWMECPKAIHSTDFGIVEETAIAKTDDSNDVVSRQFIVQIEKMADLKKIKMPVVVYDEKVTAYRQELFDQVFRDILPVKTIGQSHIWFTPWDFLVRWTGVENAMFGLYDTPELYHVAVDRLVDAWMIELDQFEEQGLLELDNTNTRVGSGGYGYISSLPSLENSPDIVKPSDMWGCSNAQIFSGVSQEMHWEFALEHDMRWLKRWGVNYYGCCEPLHNKTEILKKIPNLRKVSTSAWCDIAKTIDGLGSKIVYSVKPNPAILAGGDWSPEKARADIRKALEAGEGACMEFIMKDISTVNYEPHRLWEWAQIAMEEVAAVRTR